MELSGYSLINDHVHSGRKHHSLFYIDEYYHRLRIHRCATRGISCLTWLAWVRHTYAHFWQVQMQDFIILLDREMLNKRRF